jgi:hypothetical protein
LQILKQKGFKTFNPWIDESYDNEVNDHVRFDLIMKEIIRLNKLTHNELANMLLEMLPILLHNAKVYADLYSTPKSEEAILNKIHNTWNNYQV